MKYEIEQTTRVILYLSEKEAFSLNSLIHFATRANQLLKKVNQENGKSTEVQPFKDDAIDEIARDVMEAVEAGLSDYGG